MRITSLLVPLFAAASVSAHGFVYKVTINGQAYTGDIPSGTQTPSVIRQVSTQNPVKGASNVDLTCGSNSTAASQVADANPGDTFTFNWTEANLATWPHNIGPMLTYMANCGNTTCDQYDSSQARWFKIDQVGRDPASSNGTWFQQVLMEGGVANVTLPQTLAAGNYLIRHEIIALHLATTPGGAEFYPSCTQLRVGGSQTGGPSEEELVSLPGAYSDNDPGIYDPDVFDPTTPYVFPGPTVASFVNATPTSGASGSGSGSTSGNGTSTSTGSGQPAKSSGGSGKSCRLVRQKLSPNPSTDIVVQPRHFARIIRRMGFGLSLQ